MSTKVPASSKFNNGWGWHAFIATLLSLFFVVDTNLEVFPGWLAWLIFLPLSLANALTEVFRFPSDHGVLFVIFVGFPALMAYWYAGYSVLFIILHRKKDRPALDGKD